MRDDDISVYTDSLNAAEQKGEKEQFIESIQANVACRDEIERTLSAHYDGSTLDSFAALQEVESQFSLERIRYVLANSIQQLPDDKRITREAKDWAAEIPVCPDESTRFVCDRLNPGILNLFWKQFRKQELALNSPDNATNRILALLNQALSATKNGNNSLQPNGEAHEHTAEEMQ